MPAIRQLLSEAGARLAPVSGSARLDAEVLLRHVTGESAAWLITHADRPLSPDTHAAFAALLARRAAGEPVAYLTGEREFCSLRFEVGPAVLIPRPETELLVDTALALLPERRCKVLDLGTGSGAIAVSIATERPDCRIVATDCRADALAIARRNANAQRVRNVDWLLGDWFEPLTEREFDLILSNPPYVPAGDPAFERGDTRFEPAVALDGGADGLMCIRAIVQGATTRLAAGGHLLLEHGFDQDAAVRTLFERFGYQAPRTVYDLAGHPRVSTAVWPG